MSGGTSSIQTNKWGHNIAHLDKEWATALQCLCTWERLQLWKKDARYFTSFAKWPNWAKEWLLNWRALMRIAQSPSRMTLFTPISIANSRAFHAARVSTTRTVEGNQICYEKEAMTRPASFRTTTPIPARLSWLKRAPSKLILKLELSGVFNRSSIYICRPIYAWYVLANINICNHIMSYIIYIKFILFLPSDHFLIVIYIYISTLFSTDFLLLPLFLFM